ncbi:hypothetical protein HF295_01195 [Hujiaoplasma nucleasis]|uniref:Aldose 1-epimerase n=1 Tax=Hujiaoplasma nucleasis TaxID=2725268 RepID=A0A7L6N2V3_9MOLU|nr:hypothetical protein [Hujiaoplasma nucleasis]QLY39548.1 hypothetical protein HF295_01195 [Hujiaoplasma nucleasis]
MYEIRKSKIMDIIHIEQNGIIVDLSNYGAMIYQIQTPDQFDKYEDILLAYPKETDYIKNNIYLNASVGPICGRIPEGQLIIDDNTYQFDKNENQRQTLHSGSDALSFKYFDYEIQDNNQQTIVEFLHYSQLINDVSYETKITYTIKNSSIIIDFDISSNQKFFFNLTNHAYFNLSGNLKSSIENHIVQINTDLVHILDEFQCSTLQVHKDPLYDFTQAKSLHTLLKSLKGHPYKGYDDLYYFDKDIEPKAWAYDPISKRKLQVFSTYNHMVFYTHNNINSIPLKHLNKHPMHYGLCFECQRGPLNFKNTLLKNTYKDQIIFKFSHQ